MKTETFDYDSAFDRNIGWLSVEEQAKLRQSKVAIVGLGGTGGFQAQVLARLGVGKFNIVDPDTFELSNLNRQIGATNHSIGRDKASVISEMILSINPEAELQTYTEGFNESNASKVLEGVDLVIDGIDFFVLDAKLLLFAEARKAGIPALTSPPLGFGASLLIFSPQGMSAPEYFDLADDLDEKEKSFRLAFGLSPSPLCLEYLRPDALNVETRRASSLCPGLMLSGGITGSEAVKILCGKRDVSYAPHVFQVDLYTQKISRKHYGQGMKSAWMRFKREIVKKRLQK